MDTHLASRRLATLAALALCGALVSACGSEEPAADPSAEPTPTVTAEPTPSVTAEPSGGTVPAPRSGEVDFTEMAAFSQARLRMEPRTATPLTSEEAVRDWLPAKAPARLVRKVDAAAAQVGDGTTAYGLVLAVGCDAPKDYTVELIDGGLNVVVEKSMATATQCLVPTTWLAVVAVDAAF